MARKKKATQAHKYEAFEHPEATSPMRPDVGTQAAFKKKKPPVTYRYDSSLSPSLDWDGQNPAREQGEAILRPAARRDPRGDGRPRARADSQCWPSGLIPPPAISRWTRG